MDSPEAQRIHARFEEMRKQMFMAPPKPPTRGQINAFARLLRDETDVDPAILTEDVVTYSWYFTQDKLHIGATTSGTDQWNEAQWEGWNLAVKLDQVQRLNPSIGLTDGS